MRWIDILFGIIGNLIAAELWARTYGSAQKLIRKAVRYLPVEDRESQLKKWLSDLDEMPSAFSRFFWALNCYAEATINGRLVSIEVLSMHPKFEQLDKNLIPNSGHSPRGIASLS
jgi:hypothetical protein